MVLVGLLNVWAFVPAVFAACAMLLIRSRFAPCLRDLKRIEGLTRSPVYSQLSSTIHGLKVIRSYHAENIAVKEFSHNVDQNTRAAYLLLVANRWAAIRFDWTALFFIITVTILSVVAHLMERSLSTIDIALTLSYSLSLMSLVQWMIRFVLRNMGICISNFS